MHGNDAVDLARQALSLAQPTLACEILRISGSDDIRAQAQARYLAALAHARVGALARAEAFALSLIDDPGAAELHTQALALIGRVAKDRLLRLPPGTAREHALQRALDCYRRAWELGGGIFPAINAATMLRMRGAVESSRASALKVRELAASSTAEPFWIDATLGEAALLLGDYDLAADCYAKARDAAGAQVGHVATMRRQLRLLQHTIDVPAQVVASLDLPRVVAFTGHMIDAPGRLRPRLPHEVEGALLQRLAQRLQSMNAGFGYCSAACGADLLFVEAMLARGAEVHLTLPFARDDFLATSVAFAGTDWVARFEHALTQVTSVSYGVRERYLGDESLYPYAGALMQGAAILRARELESEPLLLAVVDRDAEREPGGARDLLERWRKLGLPSDAIDASELREVVIPVPAARSASVALPAVELRGHGLRRNVRTMLFADMVGFSGLGEEDTPSFLVHFLGAVADMLHTCGVPPVFVNTWGDGLFMVFEDVVAGADFALRLRDAVLSEDWPARGLPAGTNLRIGMHVGPVFEALDPIIGRPNYFGSHVVRAARIEPVTAPGSVFVSAELARCLAASGAPEFTTDYLGVLPLAKRYGDDSLYRLRRAHEAE